MAKKVEMGTVFESLMDFQKKEFGDRDVYMADAADRLAVGIPLPGLALRWLLDSSVLPLGRIIGLAGPPESQKSSLGYEIMRWIAERDGRNFLLDCEGKISKELMTSIMGALGIDKTVINLCRTVEETQTRFTQTFKQIQKLVPDRNLIFSFLTDSISGVTTEKKADKILDTDGYATQDYAREARAWTDFLMVAPGAIVGWPVAMVFVNHQKDKPSTMPGLPATKTMPGGMALWFRAAIHLWVQRISGKAHKEHDSQYNQEARTIKLECGKNSLGTEGRGIQVKFDWTYDAENRQISKFDWDWATARLLSEELSSNAAVKDLCPVTASSAVKFSAKTLGLKDEPPSVIGAAIHANASLFNELQNALHIKQHRIFDGTWPDMWSKEPEPKKEKPEEPPLKPKKGPKEDFGGLAE